jgi:hypothetical protein
MPKNLVLQRLVHGGVMVNYRCNAACRHCLYACSPTRKSGYVTKEKINEICRLLVKGRIGSVHIGGGEPFLDFPGLLEVIRSLNKANIRLDYIETNAFWANNPSCSEYIRGLMDLGVDALCISIDPFHAEYVPWEYPITLARTCEKQGMGYFLWKQDFYRTLSRSDGKKKQTRAEIEAAISPDYIKKTASAYGLRYNGRAMNIEEEYSQRQPAAALLDNSPCRDLLSTGHFHVDHEGFFIPPGCTGLRLPLDEILSSIETGTYPVYETLYSSGISALYEMAIKQGFTPDSKGYTSKCNLCFYIRKFLAPLGYRELDDDFYTEALKYY